MHADEIIPILNKIFADVIDDVPPPFSRTTTARDVEEWDSLNHIQFILAIEKHFKVKFGTAEIRAWKNVGEMAEAIAKRVP